MSTLHLQQFWGPSFFLCAMPQPVPSKRWSCSTLDEGVKQVLADARDDDFARREAALLREIQDPYSCFMNAQ